MRRTRVEIVLMRLVLLLAAAAAALLLDLSVAYAQTNSCIQLMATLQNLERNGDFQRSNDTAGDLRRLQRQVQRSESSYVRQGCNDDAKAGRKLSGECRALANDILDGRKQVEQLQQSAQTADAVAQQREAILQEMSRFDCDGRSSAEVRTENRGNLFEQLFGVFTTDGFDGEGGVRGEEFNPYGGYHTVRTLCVRKTDGFYWPISYSTLVDYVGNDAEQCRAMCPGLDVDLYYYDNPGQEVAQAVNEWGEPYSGLPNAFKFRTEFDTTSKCQSQQDYGSIQLIAMTDGSNRAEITFRGDTFPLPVRDPRRIANVVAAPVAPTVVAELVDVPLPRRRPAAPGETPPVAVTPVVVANQPEERVVQFGDKRVRIVGPVTPYAPQVAAGT